MARKSDLILEMDGRWTRTVYSHLATRWLESSEFGSDGGRKSMAFEGTVMQWLFMKLDAR